VEAIVKYNEMSFLAKHEDVMYAVRGEVKHNPFAGNDRQYDFPLEREVDPLSLFEQCHSIMRARMFTQPATEVEMPSSAKSSDMRRRMITLEAIMDYVKEGVEWKPLNMPTGERGKANLSRKEIIRVIHEYAEHMPLNILYDSRFVSYDSHFCPTDTPEPVPRPQKLNFRSRRDPSDVFFELDMHLQALQTPQDELPVFGMAARTLGNADILCPCETPSRKQAQLQECSISFTICEMGLHEIGSDRSFFNSVFEGCTAESRIDSADIVYAAHHRVYVRTLLRKYNTLLKARGFVCTVMQPSDLWGLGISHFNNTQYLNSSSMGDMGLDVVDMLLHPKSGVSMLNYHHVRENFHTVLSDGDREILLSAIPEQDDPNTHTRVRNVLCDKDTLSEKSIADLGFPVLTMLAESPAVVNCVRYVLEASWKDILDEFVPLLADSDEIITNLHVEAASAIRTWRGKCAAKLNKMQTCHGQAAYSFEYTQASREDALGKHGKTCPFTLSPELMAIASIMYGPCLLSFKNTQRMCDPHLCLATRRDDSQGMDGVFVLSMQDVGFDANDRAIYNNICEVFNPLSMLAVLKDDDKGIVDLPTLSQTFVRSLIAPNDVSEESSGAFHPIRKSGLMGTHVGFDFLFPSQPAHTADTAQNANNLASSQCFEAHAYWPQHWQAPFGEILHDTYEHVSAFGNYMAVLTPEPGCTDTNSCQDRLVLLPNHLRFENTSSNFFGTSGVCREPSFGMPMVPTNTHGVCTSNIRTRKYEETSAQTPESESFVCEAGNTETCSCSDSGMVGIGGGMGDTIGHLWPLLRVFLEQDNLHTKQYTIDNQRLGSMSMYDLAQYVDLEINIDLQDTDSMDDVVRDRCYASKDYANDDEFINVQNKCVYNSDCAPSGKVCGATGDCVEMAIDVQNNMRSASIEVGLNSPSCVHNQDSFSGASPWRRMRDILEQHGMCSHGNRVSYERMNDMLQVVPSAQTGCTEHYDETHDLSYWVCDRGMVNWTWVRERPDVYTPDDKQNLDMRTKHASYSILHDELFDIAPHLCDEDYMHSETLGWCGLQHSVANSGPAGEEPQNARWMRTAPLHGQFSLLKPPAADLADRLTKPTNAPRDKLRFMGMHRDLLKLNKDTSSSVRQNLAVQQCGALGVCQTEIFTAAGTHQNRMKPRQNAADLPVDSNIPLPYVTVKVSDMNECGPMGYLLEVPGNTTQLTQILCVLDKGVMPIVYWLQEIRNWSPTSTATVPSPSTACMDLFGVQWNTLGLLYNDVSQQFEYEGGRRDRNTQLQFFLNSLLLLQNVPVTMDAVLAAHKIHTCTADIAGFIHREPSFYTLPRREVGLYVLLDFGTYEVPLFWWLKYALSTVVFKVPAATQVTVSRLNSERALPIDAFEHRISTQDVMPNGGNLEGVTLLQFWSRINAQELDLFTEAHDFVVQELARYIDSTIPVSAVMGCVSDFTVDPAKHIAQRLLAHQNDSPTSDARVHKTEDMLDAVFTKSMPVALWGGGIQPGTKHDEAVGGDALTVAKQFSDTNLMGHRNGLDSIMTFEDTKFWQVKTAGFMESFLKKIFDVSIPVNTHSPVKNPGLLAQFYDDVDGGRRGIKILDLNFDDIHRELGNIDNIEDYTAEYLGTYDKMFEDYTAPDSTENAPTAPVFSTGCSDIESENQCSSIVKTHCIYDKNNQESLLKQGISQGTWNPVAATVHMFQNGNAETPFKSVDMCKKTSPFMISIFGHSGPGPADTSSPQTPPEGGRCTMSDLKVYGPGKDFTRGPLSVPADFTLMHPRSPDRQECHLAEDEAAPELMMPPEIDLTDGNYPRFVGEYYMAVPGAAEFGKPRPDNKLCMRIDSQCVQSPGANIFGTSAKHAVDLKYNTIERNAYTQVNGRLARADPALLRDYPDMHTQNLDIDEVFATSTNDIWTTKAPQSPATNECRVGKISWPEGFKVVPYVLNSDQLGSDVSFSHVIYNDRILQRRSYEDGTEQQLYAHHFVGGSPMREKGAQITSPTPLMSHCGLTEGNLHMFKRVSMQNIGRTRMYESYHRFNQNLRMNERFESVPDRVARTHNDYQLTGHMKYFLDFWDNPTPAIQLIKELLHSFDVGKSKNTEKAEWSAEGALSHQFFFNSRFRWTLPTTVVNSEPPRIKDRSFASTIAPLSKPLLKQTCVSQERTDFYQYPKYFDECKNPPSTANYQNAPSRNNIMQTLFPGAKLPKGDSPWDPYTLAAFYEQDAYQESTIRPWWSSTVCDMVQNFADRSTNYYFLDLLFERMPRKMYQMMGEYTDEGDVYNVCKTPSCKEIGSFFAKYTPFGAFIDIVDGNKCTTCRKIKDRQFNSDTWRKRARFLSNIKSVLESLFEKNAYYEQFAADYSLANTNPFTQILNLNLVVPKSPRGIGSTGPSPLSFSSCQYGSKRTGLHMLASGYCDSMHTSTHRRITKPSLWAEIDGSPGDYLVPCRKDATDNQETCYPILVPGGNTAARADTDDNIWTKQEQQSGACSYSVEFEGAYFCGPLEFVDSVLQDCENTHKPQLHPAPVRGTSAEDNLMWKCVDCNKYSETRPILQNPENVRGPQSPVRSHRVGCGIYTRKLQTKTQQDRKYSGPLTQHHSDYPSIMRDIRSGLQNAFQNASHIETTLKAQLALVFGDKVFIHDNALWWDVAATNTTQIDHTITEPFREFGSGESVGNPHEGCAVGNIESNLDDCSFLTYDAGFAYGNSILFQSDLDNGCMAEDNKQDDLSQFECSANITDSTVDRIKVFTDEIHNKKFGLKLPIIEPRQVRQTKVAPLSFVSWIDGVLPFYAATVRTNQHSKDTGDYLAYVLDQKARCQDSYYGQSITNYACYMDAANEVQLVVPWLGKDYSFLKRENRLKIHQNPRDIGTEAPEQELFRLEMGTDLCFAEDGVTRLPCTATACLDDMYETFENKTLFCESSAKSDSYYASEVAKKLDRVYVERLHPQYNLFNPMANRSQCYIKYTPQDTERKNGRQCRHLQAPLGYSPSILRPFSAGVSSLNRSKVQIASNRIRKHEFFASPRPPRYSSLWAGGHMSSNDAEGAVSSPHTHLSYLSNSRCRTMPIKNTPPLQVSKTCPYQGVCRQCLQE